MKIFKSLFTFQFLKYILVGLLATGLDFSFLYILVEYFHLYYLLSALISMSILLLVSFALNKFWTFQNYEDKYIQQFGKYCLSHLIALTVNLSIMIMLVEGLKFWYMYAKVFATAGAAITNFLFVRKFIFFNKPKTLE